ncbi:cytochrome P450 [Aspergillus pseudotamarii]|uniref:Cytochrome P450 n=1 Tax=Aspergillus pseudotamarii TaxID=132259 RepID=A0A5N6T9W8_ASPPS|nr:cytochrome P450 [Aspergillus pseudotamarii]KAE8143102.1 cytochrome P450 [Aspergillus pseudotamarii]
MAINWFHLDSITANVVVGVVIIAVLFVEISKRIPNPSKLPVFNDRKWFEFGYGKATARYIADPEGWIRHGLKNGGDAFYLCTEAHFRLILSPKYADVIGGDNRFDLGVFVGEDFHAGIPGFEPLANIALESKILQTTVKTKLSRQTPKLVSPLSTEASWALQTNWTEESEWHQVNLKQTMSQIVAQMVTRGFLGDVDLCRNPAWLNCIYDFLEDSFIAAHHLRRWPMPLRLLASRFMPSCRKVREELQKVIKYLEPLLDKADGPDAEMTAISWVKEASKGSAYDFTTLQLTLALASLDTSNDLLVKTICDLSTNPTLVDDIRKEIIEVVGEAGLTKSSLQRLFLLDSAMKESQRLRPLGYSNMERVAKERVVLPDGLIIPKGTAIMVSACHMMDSSVWPDGDKYDGYRFATLRKNAKNSLTSPFQLTSTSSDHMGFGHGKQACPGRHYAAIFGKILLCHVLLKYDFNVILPEEGCIQLRGHNILPHANIKINIRRRKAEISL